MTREREPWFPSPGDSVLARDAFGELLPRLAVSGPEGGAEHDFPVVLLTFPHHDWQTTREVWPWPLEDVLDPAAADSQEQP